METIKLTYDDLDRVAGGKRMLAFAAENENGELVEIYRIHDEAFTVATYQENGWTQLITVWKDGTIEETYDREEVRVRRAKIWL